MGSEECIEFLGRYLKTGNYKVLIAAWPIAPHAEISDIIAGFGYATHEIPVIKKEDLIGAVKELVPGTIVNRMPLGWHRMEKKLDDELAEALHSVDSRISITTFSTEVDFADQYGNLSIPLIRKGMTLSHVLSYFCFDFNPFSDRIKSSTTDPTDELRNRVTLFLMALDSQFKQNNPNFKDLKEELIGLYGRAFQMLQCSHYKEGLNELLVRANGSFSILSGNSISQEDVRRHFQKKFCVEEYPAHGEESLKFEFPFGVYNNHVYFLIAHKNRYIGYEAWLFRNIYKNGTSLSIAPHIWKDIAQQNLCLFQVKLLQEFPNLGIVLVHEKWKEGLSPLNKFYLACQNYAVMRKSDFGTEH